MRLAGKSALVTGTSPNICGGIAEGLAGEGTSVACVDINGDYANRCAKSIASQGGRAIGLVCDVTEESQVKAAVDQARDTFGSIDILVNDAVLFNRNGCWTCHWMSGGSIAVTPSLWIYRRLALPPWRIGSSAP